MTLLVVVIVVFEGIGSIVDIVSTILSTTFMFFQRVRFASV